MTPAPLPASDDTAAAVPVKVYQQPGTKIIGWMGVMLGIFWAYASIAANTSLVMPAMAAVFAVTAWVLLLRPRLKLGSEHIEIIDPFRRHWICLHDVEEVTHRMVLVVHTEDHDFSSSAIAVQKPRFRPAPKDDWLTEGDAPSPLGKENSAQVVAAAIEKARDRALKNENPCETASESKWEPIPIVGAMAAVLALVWQLWL